MILQTELYITSLTRGFPCETNSVIVFENDLWTTLSENAYLEPPNFVIVKYFLYKSCQLFFDHNR